VSACNRLSQSVAPPSIEEDTGVGVEWCFLQLRVSLGRRATAGALPGLTLAGADVLHRPLVPRCGFRQWFAAGVRLLHKTR